jgi:hypothetical protein
MPSLVLHSRSISPSLRADHGRNACQCYQLDQVEGVQEGLVRAAVWACGPVRTARARVGKLGSIKPAAPRAGGGERVSIAISHSVPEEEMRECGRTLSEWQDSRASGS